MSPLGTTIRRFLRSGSHGATTILLACFMAACSSGSDTPQTGGTVNFMLSSVDGGSCSLLDAATGATRLAGPVTTRQGVATFSGVDATLGLVRVECSGGTFIDEATGVVQTAPRTRSYATIGGADFKVTASALTEIAVRIVEERPDLKPSTDFAKVLANVATSFGLEGIDLAAVTPIDLNKTVADNSDAGHYGVSLAVISQLESDLGEGTEDEVVATLVSGLANNGQFTRDDIRDLYMAAMENLFANPRIAANAGLEADLHQLFDQVAVAPLASQVDHVDAEHSLLQNGNPTHTIAANQRSLFDIVGTHLHLGMTAKLGDDACELRDLRSAAPYSHDTFTQVMMAECPSRPAGTADFVVLDRGRLENTTKITVAVAQEPSAVVADERKFRLAVVGGGSSFIRGKVTAEAPGIAPPDAAHNYNAANLEIFNVAGVTVDLIDGQGTVLASAATAADGTYSFEQVPQSLAVRLVVKAQLQRTRTTPNIGPQYDFAVRDNTSTTSPKQAYQIVSAPITTSASPSSINTIDVRARIGFDGNGNVIDENLRQSAPFAILRIVNAAAVNLTATDPNITMPALNIYWSVKNVAASGDKQQGQINTSHYAGDDLLPGLYILGKADADTDEFDQGVIGHELGHYLQRQLSYSDSPGGSHSSNEFKDASLAFGEGYGTAVGGLLASGPNSRFYCDVSGSQQREGFCRDLTQPNGAGEANGFYAEYSVVHLMYAIGTLPGQGFAPFFNAFTQMRSAVHSATIFAFLDNYIRANPGVSSQVQSLMAINNIKTSNPFGTLPTGTPADPALSATASKGLAASGANDLERLYVTMPLLPNVPAPSSTQPPNYVTADEPTFCLNENLKGAQSANGLGMLRRFLVTANFTGKMLLRAVDDNGRTLSLQGTYFSVRDDLGANVGVFGYSGVDSGNYYGRISVAQGRSYTITLHVYNTAIILNGSQCGNALWPARAAE